MSTDRTIDPSHDPRNHAPDMQAVLQRCAAFHDRAGAQTSADDLQTLEAEARATADALFQALMTPALQRAVDAPAVQAAAGALVRAQPRRLRCEGRVTVNVRTSRGAVIPIHTPYYRERSRGRHRRPGLYPALAVLGIWDRCTPLLASTVSRAVAMLSSIAEAQTHLAADGIPLDPKTVRGIAYQYAARARAAQHAGCFDLDTPARGRRVVVSIDGGRVRVRRNKRGPKTRKGRTRYRTDWHEPKLIIVYVVDDDGRPARTWAPIIDGTLRGPDAAVGLLRAYAEQIGLTEADTVLFVADGARWIWTRLARLVAALGLRSEQVVMLIDFYHAVQQLASAVKLRRWSDRARRQWLARTRGRLRRGDIEAVITALTRLCRGRNAGKIRTHLNYFIRNRHRFAYPRLARLKLPKGSGAIESAIRRVVNLRIKGASIYWLEESVEAILLLRSFYKSKRWHCLEQMATCPEHAFR